MSISSTIKSIQDIMRSLSLRFIALQTPLLLCRPSPNNTASSPNSTN
jgi:hypothetical protein